MYIKDVENELGIDRETVRFYIGQGLIEPDRDEYNYRVYTDDVVLLLKKSHGSPRSRLWSPRDKGTPRR